MRILLAIDGSPESDAAVREVGLRPWAPSTEVRVITVGAPLGERTEGGMGRGEPTSCRRVPESFMLALPVAAVRTGNAP